LNRTIRLLLSCAALLVGAVALLLLLNQAKFSSTFDSRLRQRVAITGQDAARSLDAQMALGIVLSDTPAQRGLLQRAKQAEPAIEALAVIDPRGKILLSEGDGSAQLWRAAHDEPANSRGWSAVTQGDRAALSMPLTNAYGVAAGELAVQYNLKESRNNVHSAFESLLWIAGIGLGISLITLAVLGPRLMGGAGAHISTSFKRLSIMLLALVLGLQGLIAFDSYRSFQRIALQDAPSLAAAMARAVEPTLIRALKAGVPLDTLEGTEAWLASTLDAGAEFASVALLDGNGRELSRASRPGASTEALRLESRPVVMDGQTVATLQIGLDTAALSERTRQLAIEFLMLLLAGGLLIHEVLAALTSSARTQAIRAAGTRAPGNENSLDALRFPLFLYFLGSELPRSFLPVWARDLAQRPAATGDANGLMGALMAPLHQLPESMQATLPLSIFLLAVAVSSPFAGAYCARFGARRLLLVGMVFAVTGHLLSMIAESMPTLVLARIVAGISFGCVSLAALDFIGRQSGGRAAGMAMYLAAYVAAGIAGSGLGALIYDRSGTGSVFAFGVLCSAAALVSLRQFPQQAPSMKDPPRLMNSLGLLLRTPGFQKLILLASLPLQIVQQGLLFYWVPLAVLSLGERTSFTGLAMMAYFAMVLLFNKPLAKFADRGARYGLLLAAGLALAGVAGLVGGVVSTTGSDPTSVGTGTGATAIFVSVILIGIAWALAFPSQGALALRVSGTELPNVDPAVSIGVYRTIERFGAMITPIVTAALIAALGLAGSAIALSVLLILCGMAQLYFSRQQTS